MKNLIPLIIALIVGTIDAFLIWDHSRDSDKKVLKTIKIAVANDDIAGGTVLQEAEHVVWVELSYTEDKTELIDINQFITDSGGIKNTVTRVNLEKGTAIRRSDLSDDDSLDQKITPGHWAVPLSFDDERLVEFIRPGMEIAILGSFKLTKRQASMELSGEATEITQQGTMVVLPKVVVMSIGRGEENNMGEVSEGAVIILDLSPELATILVAAQREMELYPVIRRMGDSSNIDRTKIGIVTPDTFGNMTKDLKQMELPKNKH